MTAKRFQIDFDEEAITDNGEYCISLYCFQDKGERVVCDLLNQLNEENEELKKQLQSEHQMLENAILLERTRMGKNCLKQYKEAIQ